MSDTQKSGQIPQGQTIIINQQEGSKSNNGIGTAGFVLALIAIFMGIFIGWIPILNFIVWFVWFLGLVFSFIGVFKKPKTLAIIGLVISLIGIILTIFVFSALISGLAFTH